MDASIRRAAVGGTARKVNWSATVKTGTWAVVWAFGANCKEIGTPRSIESGATVVFPAGTQYVGVSLTSTFAQLTWSLT